MVPVKRVAVIGAGPAGAIAIDALAQEKTFDIIRVFERREGAGGCWFVFFLSKSSLAMTDMKTQDWRLIAASNTPRLCIASDKNSRSTTTYPRKATCANSKVRPASLY